VLKDMERAKDRFLIDTCDHQMSVELAEGAYTHLRFAQPKTNIYAYGIMSWPGYLTICGDTPAFIFSREPDMLAFFEKCGEIPDPVYLSGKLLGQPKTKRYSPDAFKREVERWLRETLEQIEDEDEREFLKIGVKQDLLRSVPDFAEEALPRLEAFEAEGHRIQDPFEWDLCDWDQAFLWSLWAITEGIKQFREATE